MTIPSIIGVIPAAGRSTRIGNPKPLLDANGRTFLERAATALREGGVERIFVGVREPRGPIAALAGRLGTEVLVPDDLEDGPIASIRAALRASDAEALVLLPVDFPLVQPSTVASLLASFATARSSLIRPEYRGKTGHPVLFGAEHFAELLDDDLAEGARSVVDRHRALGETIEVDDPGILVDIDTLPEYRRHFPDSWRKRFQKW